ncbi:MAG TPA: alpha/beta fold hydrolase [Candidatus Acidoferrum sp.]|nr:alpha/beta fold hydrolase [Candidatus Acidoferrum sp.]
MPSAFPPFHPYPLLKNGHAMTVASAFWRRTFALPPPDDRLFQVDPESKILGHCHWQSGKDKSTPLLVLVHGLEGSSDSNYMRGIAEKAFERGFHAIRLNQRNCGGTELLTPTLYNSGMSADYRAVLEELAARDGFTQIFFAGYSMGGNLVTKMAGEFGSSPPAALRGVAAICPALNLAACADALERRDNFFYQRHFVAGLMSRYAKKARLFPQRYSLNGFGRIRTVREFDDAITAPCFGYKDADEYYEAAGAKRVVRDIRVPYLLITAQDDPFVPFEATRASGIEQNPHATFIAPAHGGHCAFISNQRAERFWAESRIVDFCQTLAGKFANSRAYMRDAFW